MGYGGGNTPWKSVKKGHLLTLNADGTYSTTQYEKCNTGKYTVEDNILTLKTDCRGVYGILEETSYRIIQLENQILVLRDITYCTEECLDKFKKVK